MNPLGKNINILRKAFGLTQDELGKLVKGSKSKISRYEAGDPVPPYELGLLAKHFHVSVETLENKEFTSEEADTLAVRYSTKGQEEEVLGLLSDEGINVYNPKSKKQQQDQFDVSLAVHTGKVISMILDKHRTPREYYATQVLKKDTRTLQRICKGEIMAGFEVILQVALDHNEPLELFRTGPLPQGHILAQLRDKETIIDTQRQLINQLQQRA